MVRVALFGAGRIGRVHAASLAAHPRAELVTVCDPMEQFAAELAGKFGATSGSDVDSVFSDDSIDAVVIGSPTPTHVDLVSRAVLAGKAVLCEKPIDLDIARVDACWEQISDVDHTVMIGFNRRFDPSFADIHRRVEAGEVGSLEQLIIISRDPEPPPAAYIASSGGLFRDMTIHDFDMARFFLGDVVDVQATGTNLVADHVREAGDIDGAVVVLRGSSGAVAQITNSRRCAFGYDQRLEAFGSAGMLTADNLRPTSVRYSGAERTESAAPYLDFFLERYHAAYRAELDHFISSIENSNMPSPSFSDGRAALVLADAAGESMRTGRVVRVG
ncbi:MAG: inositol 2-dehydrogenase [Nakamurella sp.]